MKSKQTNELVDLLFQLTRSIRSSMSYDSNTAHLSVVQLQALIFLKNKPLSQMHDIAAYFNSAQSTATVLLDKLIADKLVKRESDPHDRRIIRASLTKRGEQVLKKACDKRTEKIKKVLSYLTANEQEKLLQIMKSLYQKINHEK